MSPLLSASASYGYLIAAVPPPIRQPILPDLSSMIKTFAGTSPIPVPGGKAFANKFSVASSKKNKLNINFLIFIVNFVSFPFLYLHKIFLTFHQEQELKYIFLHSLYHLHQTLFDKLQKNLFFQKLQNHYKQEGYW